jgi:hypothetical protein
MPMPEAPMDEDQALPSTEHQIRLARQCSGVEPIPEAEPMHEAANHQFRLRVLRLDTAHAFASLLRRECIHGSPTQTA